MSSFFDSLSKSPGPLLIIVGILCFLLGSIGKVPGKIYDGKIVELNKWVRVFTALFGVAIVLIGFVIYAASYEASVPPPAPGPQPTAVPSPTSPAPQPTATTSTQGKEYPWKLVTENPQVSSVVDTNGNPYEEIAFQVSIQNIADQSQPLNPEQFELRDGNGHSYAASNFSSTTFDSQESRADNVVFDVPTSVAQNNCWTLTFHPQVSGGTTVDEWQGC